MKDRESLAFKDVKLGKENEAVVKRVRLGVVPTFLLLFQCSWDELGRTSRSFPFSFKESDAPMVPLYL